jgi:hypothetical protein
MYAGVGRRGQVKGPVQTPVGFRPVGDSQQNEDLRTIGQKLGVAAVLEGSVQTAGDRVRITVQLINAADGYHLWSEKSPRRPRGGAYLAFGPTACGAIVDSFP